MSSPSTEEHIDGEWTRAPEDGPDQEKVIDAALAFVDEHGLAALSNRKLGAALGVEGMTLYYYVPSKAALLDGMVERLLELSAGDLFTEPAGRPWTTVVGDFAAALRRILLDHPAMLTVLATRPAATPAALHLLERGVGALRADRVPLADALDVLNAVASFTLGHTLAEVGETPTTRGRSPIRSSSAHWTRRCSRSWPKPSAPAPAWTRSSASTARCASCSRGSPPRSTKAPGPAMRGGRKASLRVSVGAG